MLFQDGLILTVVKHLSAFFLFLDTVMSDWPLNPIDIFKVNPFKFIGIISDLVFVFPPQAMVLLLYIFVLVP